jgi:hypothetical protein
MISVMFILVSCPMKGRRGQTGGGRRKLLSTWPFMPADRVSSFRRCRRIAADGRLPPDHPR